MPEQPSKAAGNLAEHINELESLIDTRKPAASAAAIPILDDVVEPGIAPDAEPLPAAETPDLEARLLRRVDAELADLGRVIRDIIHRCIREELDRGTGDQPQARDKPGPGT